MVAAYQGHDLFTRPAAQRLEQFVQRERESPSLSFEDYERELRRLMQELESEVAADQLKRYDVDDPEIEIGGKKLRFKMSNGKTYHLLSGAVEIERSIYVPSSGPGKAVCPLELTAGIVEGCWSPLAGRVMAHSVAISTPKEAQQLLAEVTALSPSTSSLDRVHKGLTRKWEQNRESFETELRQQELVPESAVSVAVSLDGVLAPMKDGNRVEKRSQSDKRPQGPAGYREVGCATVTFYDAEGDALDTKRYARGPEHKKKTLKSQVTEELRSIFAAEPGLELVVISDGAPDHWEYFDELPDKLGIPCLEVKKVVDLFHVLERIKNALDAYHGESTPESKATFEDLRVRLRECDDGVQRVLRSLRYRRDKSRGATYRTIDREIRYIEKRAALLRYKELLDRNLPVGSGVVEAACKTLVTERLKRSGMSWREAGLQSILTLRSLLQSDRWMQAWALIANEYKSRATAA